MPLTREQLREQLKRREVAPVYTLYGEETFLRDAAARYIADLCFGESDLREFNETEFSLNTSDNLNGALTAAEQLPMMAAKRVIRICDVRVAATSNRDTLKEEACDELAAYLDNPSSTSVVIFVADELNTNRKAAKLLKTKTAAVEFERLNENGLYNWVEQRVIESGSVADPATIRYLISVVGNDVRRLSNETKKLSTAALPASRITPDLVDALVPNSSVSSAFGVGNHLVAGQPEKALAALKKLLNDGAEPVALLGLIASNYRRLLKDGGVSYGSSRIDTERLARAIERIASADLAIKTSTGGSGNAGARLQLEMLVCELALI